MKRTLPLSFRLLLGLLLLAGQVMAADLVPGENGKYDQLYDRPTHFPDFEPTRRFPNNMTYIISARWGRYGELLPNYEVAVYTMDNELRAVQRSITKDRHICVINISGTEGETFRFEVIHGDIDHPTITKTPQTCAFQTNDIVGHPMDGEPFWLTLPVTPSLECWNTTAVSTPAAATFTLEQLTSGQANAALQQARVLKFKGSWGSADLQTTSIAAPQLCYVEMEEAPQGVSTAFANVNPNCLFFFPPELAQAPNGLGNVVAGDRALTDIHLNGSTPTAIHPFFNPRTIRLNGHKATFTRPTWAWADGKSGWNTLVLPFDAQLVADGEAMTPYRYTTSLAERYINRGIRGYWLAQITTAGNTKVETALVHTTSTLNANTPYLISLPGSRFFTNAGVGNTTTSISLQDKDIRLVSVSDQIPATPTTLRAGSEVEDELSDHPFVGTYQPVIRKPMYVLKNKVGANGLTGFVYNTEASILPFQAYLEAGNGQTSTLTIHRALDDSFMDNNITGIERTSTPDTTTSFTLDGRPLSGNALRGIIIKNNQKTFWR